VLANSMKTLYFVVVGAALMSCDDRASHSLTPANRIASFTINSTAEEADQILSDVAKQSGETFVRHPYPQSNAIPRDYISTIATRRCLILAEGENVGGALQLTVSLDVLRGKTCEPQVSNALKRAQFMFKERVG